MEKLKQFMLSKPKAQRVMIIAVVVLFVSQFLPYFNDAGSGYLLNATNTDYYTGIVYTGGRVGIGWALHPLAFIIIPVLAFAFLREDLVGKELFDRFGYWAAAVLVFIAGTPGAPFRASGAALGLIAFFTALAAAWLHRRARKSAPPLP